MRRTGVAGAALIAAFISMTCTATASTVKVCVPKRQGAAIVTPSRGRCRRGYALAGLGPEGKAGKSGAEGRAGAEGKPGPEGKVGTTGFTASELETLKALLPHIRFSSAGVDGKPTVQFTGVNVQVVNGAGKTATANGEGNLIIGYDENEAKHEQSGSHDLVLGEEQTFTSFGGLVAGWGSSVTGSFASVTGGEDNSASGDRSSVSGGSAGTASGAWASVSGGYFEPRHRQPELGQRRGRQHGQRNQRVGERRRIEHREQQQLLRQRRRSQPGLGQPDLGRWRAIQPRRRSVLLDLRRQIADDHRRIRSRSVAAQPGLGRFEPRPGTLARCPLAVRACNPAPGLTG